MVRPHRTLLGAALAAGLLGALAPAATLAQDECPETTTEENVALVQSYVDAFGSGDTETMDSLLSDDLQHNLSRSGIEVPNEPGNADELATYNDAGGAEIGHTINAVFGSGNQVAVAFDYSVSPDAVAGSTATEPTQHSAIAVVTIECGTIANVLIETDSVGILLAHGQVIDPAS